MLASATVAALALGTVGIAIPATAAVSADSAVVINEVYGGGGNSGATLTHDFIELVNTSDTAVSIDGWTLQYASAGGTFNSRHTLTGSIAPGGYFLVQEAQGTGGTTPLPTPDATGTLGLSGTGGKVALANADVAVSAPADAAVVGWVAWGASSTPFPGTGPAPATTNSTSVSRNADHANTANNAADFTSGAPTPENSGAGSNPDPEPEPEPTVATIAEIQGTGSASPLAGQTVTTEGVVTAHYPTAGYAGYVIQTAGTGGAIDFATHSASDAVFVYSPAATSEVAIGDTVRVTGAVSEFNGLTEITVSAGGATVIEDAAAPIPIPLALPRDEAQRESIESMLVLPTGDYTVSNTYTTFQYGEVGLAYGDEPLLQGTEVALPGSDEYRAVLAENAARAITLDDGGSTNFLTAQNSTLIPAYVSLTEPIVTGAAVTFTEPVVMDYRNNLWKFNPTRPLVGDGTGDGDGVDFENTRTPAPAPVGGDLSVASFNVLNYFTTLGDQTSSCTAYVSPNGVERNNVNDGCDQRGAWDAADLERQQNKIVSAINALDASVVGLMEIENSARLGETPDTAVSTLVDALNDAAGSDKWAFVPSSSELPAPSGQDVISNAIIFQPALVERVGASRALGTESETGEAFQNAREPLGQVFAPADGGEPFLFVVNHFKSKGSVGPWPGDVQTDDGQGTSNESRVRQANALTAWIDEIQGDTEAVVLAGDFNSYTQEDPMHVLYDAGYTDAATEFDANAYSYVFQGLSGSLDHVLLNDAALTRATGGDVWNINSGEALALEYSRYNYNGMSFHADDPYRSSDHDPVKVGLTAGEAAPAEITLLGINDFHGRITGVTPADAENAEKPGTVGFAGTLEEQRAAAQGDTLFLSAGDNIGASLFASSVAQDQPTIDVLNALGLQTSAVGNHEFDKGFDDLSGRVEDAADFSYLGANVYDAGTQTPALKEYELLQAEGLTVGVVGVVTQETPTLVSPAGVASLDFGDPVEAVNRVAAQLSDGDPSNGEADIVIAMYHEGAGSVSPDATLDELVADGGVFASIVNDTSPEVDAIYTGHTHQTYAWSAPIPGTDRTRPIVQTGSYGANLGKITLSVDRESGDVLSHTEENVPVTKTPAAQLIAEYPRVAEVNEIVTDALDYAAEIGNTRVGSVADDITTAFSGGSFVNGVWTGGERDDRASESSLGNLVAESIRASLAELPDGAQIGVTNPGGLRAELYDTQAEFGDTAVRGLADGDISFSQALAVLPFNNTMGLITLTGEQFTALLEQQWQRDEDGEVPSRAYLQLGLSDNVSYTYDATRAEGDRITSVTVDGLPLDPAAEYRIGTLSFLAQGGDNFRGFLAGTDYVDTGLLDYEAWTAYLRDQSADEPIPASFAKHAVSVQNLPETTAPGETATFQVSNLNLTSLGTPETTELAVTVDGESAGTVPVVGGSADVSVAVPADAVDGSLSVVLTSEVSGTVVTVPVQVGTGAEAPNGSWATVTLGSDRVEQGGTLNVTVTGLQPGQQIGATLFSDPIVVNGIPAADALGRTAFRIAIPSDLAVGAHTLEVTTPGEAPIRVALTVLPRGALAATGSEFPFGIALGAAGLLVVAGLVLAMRRRPQVTRG